MVSGFENPKVRNANGGEDPVKYSSMSIDDIDRRLELAGQPWQPATELPNKLPVAGAKEKRAELAAIYADFMTLEKACERLSVGNADFWFTKWKEDAVASGEPGD